MKSQPPLRVSALLISLVGLLSIGLSARQPPDPRGDQIPTTEIDLSSTLGTPSEVYGINDIGTIVGTHTVIVSVSTPPFRWSTAGLQDLSFDSRFCNRLPECHALAVNNNDEVVGDWFTGGDVARGLVWLTDEATAISSGTAYDINDSTTVVGFNVVPVGSAPGTFGYRWTPATGLGYLDPGAPGFFAPDSEARAIRNDGVVAGWREGQAGRQAVIWQRDGSVTELGGGVVNAISDNSLAVGRSGLGSGHPIAWREGTAIQISPADGEAFDVNEAGYVVGTIDILGEAHAFVWHEARGLQDLGSGTAHGIDEAGNIVGWRTTDGVNRATRWQAELRVEDLFIGLEAIAGRLLAGIDDSQAEKALRDISRARDEWTQGDSKHASQRLTQALRAVVKLNRSGELSDVRATAVLSLGNTLLDRL
jgi:probable HAF family extracellular repeat protein